VRASATQPAQHLCRRELVVLRLRRDAHVGTTSALTPSAGVAARETCVSVRSAEMLLGDSTRQAELWVNRLRL